MRTFAPLVVMVLSGLVLGQAPVEDLLKDVKVVAGPGSPGVVLSLKETVSPVVVGGLDGGTMGPVAVAGTWGKGRMVGFGHSGYIDKDNFKAGETERLMERLAVWAATGAVVQPNGAAMNAVVVDGDLVPWLSARGFTVARGGAELLTEQALKKTTLVVIGGRDLTVEQSAALSAYVKGGGGLMAAQTGWGWQQIKGGPDMRTNSLNRLLLEAGVAWTDEIIDKTAGEGFDATKRVTGPATLEGAVGVLLAGDAETVLKDKVAETARQGQLKQAAAIVSRGVRVLPETDQTVRPRLAGLLAAREQDLVPTEKRPLDQKRPLLRSLMALQVEQLNALPPERVMAHPAAADFPGAVAADAARVTRTVSIDRRVPRWHSVGLYAPAGGVVKVTVPEGVKGLSVRIGCHTDRLWHLGTWKRVPQITLDKGLSAGENVVASPFGGILYIEVDRAGEGGPVSLTVRGCVEAPLFVLGKTSVEEWKETIRHAPGPWAELVTPSVIVSVPSSAVRGLDDPTEICTLWQSILDHAADLGSIPRDRSSPERYVPDVQISAGYMHSGYPIMTHMDVVDDLSVAAKLRGGSWGLFHEMGHNHQDGMWTFEGTGEVTCNLWSLYLMENIAGKQPGVGHDAIDSREKRLERALKHVQTGAKFDKWKADPFLALEMYIQLREAFGWEPFKKVFGEYESLAQPDRPRSDEQKHDQWMVRMSKATGKNLGPFFVKWGVPTSEGARRSIADLPVWMPDEFKNAGISRR